MLLSNDSETSPFESDFEKLSITWNYQIYVDNGDIRAEKEIRLWSKQGAVWHCKEFIPITLSWEIGYYDQNNQLNYTHDFNENLFVNKDAIQFNGGFLKLNDPGLISPLGNIGISITDEPISSSLFPDYPITTYHPHQFQNLRSNSSSDIERSLLEYVEDPFDIFGLVTAQSPIAEPLVDRLNPVGRNFHLEVDFSPESKQKKFQPILYFPMGDNYTQSYLAKNTESNAPAPKDYGHIYAGVWSNELTHLAYWKIADHPKYLCIPYQIKGMHKLIVSQDATWHDTNWRKNPNKKTKFEFFVNSIGLHLIDSNRNTVQDTSDIDSAPNTYVFAPRERSFFIGVGQKTPALNTEDPKDENKLLNPDDPAEVSLFKGKIKRIFFDPNSACDGC